MKKKKITSMIVVLLIGMSCVVLPAGESFAKRDVRNDNRTAARDYKRDRKTNRDDYERRGDREKKDQYSKKKRSRAETRDEDRKFMIGLGGGFFKGFDSVGSVLKLGYGGKLYLQYNFIAEGFGIELEGSYYHMADKSYKKNYVDLVPVLVFPRYQFVTEYIDIHLTAGAGFSYTMTHMDMYGIFKKRGSSFDPVVGAGAGLSKTFGEMFIVGAEVKYYFIFQSLSMNALTANIFFGLLF